MKTLKLKLCNADDKNYRSIEDIIETIRKCGRSATVNKVSGSICWINTDMPIDIVRLINGVLVTTISCLNKEI